MLMVKVPLFAQRVSTLTFANLRRKHRTAVADGDVINFAVIVSLTKALDKLRLTFDIMSC